MRKVVKEIDKTVNGILGWVVVLMLAVMSVVVFAQVAFRLVHASIPWSEELSKYLLIWSTFLGSALCIRKGSLVGLEIIFMVLPKKAGKVVSLLIQALTAAFLLFLIVVGYKTAALVWTQTTPVLKMSMGLMYASIPTGALFMLVNTIFMVYYQIAGEEEEK
ncbi:MAG: TRAP transporter small permease [Lachnospiraceae bacterium]